MWIEFNIPIGQQGASRAAILQQALQSLLHSPSRHVGRGTPKEAFAVWANAHALNTYEAADALANFLKLPVFYFSFGSQTCRVNWTRDTILYQTVPSSTVIHTPKPKGVK